MALRAGDTESVDGLPSGDLLAHCWLARFRATHTETLAGLFGQVLALCARAGVLRPGLLAIDRTKLAANASRDANRTAAQLAEEILAEAAAVDAAEDAAAEPVAELPVGWAKTIAGGRQLRCKGRERNRAWFKMTAAVHNVIASPPSTPNKHSPDRARIDADPRTRTRGRARGEDERATNHTPLRCRFSAPCQWAPGDQAAHTTHRGSAR